MAQRGGKQVPSSSGSRSGAGGTAGATGKSSGPRPPVPAGSKSPSSKPSGSAKTPGGSGSSKPSGKSGSSSKSGRQSVAAARKSSGDRTQLIIGGIAVAIIAIIVVVGVVLYKKSTAVQGSGYGVSKASTASVDGNGIITVSNGSPSLVLDIYEDALCPICGDFEHQFGQQIAKAIDDGQLIVRYHMVNFLDGSSASKDYSTRAYGALLTVGKGAGGVPGQFMAFHSALFDSTNQPKEDGATDHTNAQLASPGRVGRGVPGGPGPGCGGHRRGRREDVRRGEPDRPVQPVGRNRADTDRRARRQDRFGECCGLADQPAARPARRRLVGRRLVGRRSSGG